MNIKSKPVVIVAFIIVFAAGFFLGMEYKAYQIREAISKAFSDTSAQPTSTTVMNQAKQEAMKTVTKGIGDEITLSTGKIKVNSSTEQQTISSQYGSPQVAKDGTKFVVVNLDVTNTTNSEFTFFPDDVFVLVDNQKREYKTYGDTIGNIDNYLDSRSLSPSITETGVLVYELPNDATSYSLVTSKGGTKELYEIKLK